jgi:hypothetical protein
MSARQKLIDLARFVLKGRTDACDWKDDAGEMLSLARKAMAAVDEEDRKSATEDKVSQVARKGSGLYPHE